MLYKKYFFQPYMHSKRMKKLIYYVIRFLKNLITHLMELGMAEYKRAESDPV